MSDLVVIEYMSLDGVVQGPGHRGEDDFADGGWTEPQIPDHRTYGTDLYRGAGAFLFGRRTYEIWLDHWPNVTDPDDHIAAALNNRPKYVVSNTLDEPSWAGTTIIRGDVLVESVRALKVEDGGDIVVPGSGGLVHALTAAQLVDRYQLWIHPVAVGNGKRLFAERTDLRLVDARITATGLALLTYEPLNGNPT
jgi:dihydrofolate reductase